MKYINKIIAISTALLLFLFILSGCGGKPATAEDTANTFFTAVQKQDEKAAAEVYAGNIDDLFYFDHNSITETEGLDEDSQEAAKTIRGKLADFDYTLSDVKEDGNKATISVTLSTYDFEDYISDALSDTFDRIINAGFNGTTEEALNRDDVFAALSDYLFELNSKATQDPITIHLTKSGDTWTVDTLSEGDLNALTGGAYSMLKGLASLQNE